LKKLIKTTKNSSAEKTESNVPEKKPESEEKKEVRRCNECKWYDVSTQRDFFRKVGPRDESGQRTKIKEIRAVCRSPTSRAKGHLVKSDSDRPCFEKGKYVPPEKPKKETETKQSKGKKKEKVEGSKQTKNTAKKNTVTLKNPLNDETKTFKKRGRRLVVAKTTN